MWLEGKIQVGSCHKIPLERYAANLTGKALLPFPVADVLNHSVGKYPVNSCYSEWQPVGFVCIICVGNQEILDGKDRDLR